MYIEKNKLRYNTVGVTEFPVIWEPVPGTGKFPTSIEKFYCSALKNNAFDDPRIPTL